MAYLVTARKWRPQKFDDVVGQEHITGTLKNAIKEKKIAHAYLFAGPRGVGKTTTARILAKTLNCENPVDSEPCGKCEMCKSISSTQTMDIIEIDGASNRGIDEIRTLRESVKYAPTRGKYKVYIIDEVHMLTKESFNAFLKTLEEPPEHIVFIFATTDVHKVPLTIISRCQRYDFRRIQLDTIKKTLANIAKEEKINIDDKTLTIISKKADGALRDAESYFDQVIAYCSGKIDAETVSQMLNLIDEEIYFRISDSVLNKDYKSVFEISNTIFKNGWDFLDFIDGLNEHFRNILTVVVTEKPDLAETAEIFKARYMDYKDKFSEGDLLRLLGFLNKVQHELRYSQNQKLKVEIALSHLVGLERSQTLSILINELKNVPEIVTSGNEFPNKTVKNIFDQKKTVSSLLQKKSEVTPGTVSTSESSIENFVHIGELDFNRVVEMWQGFVNAVNSEKGLILGPVIENMKPVNLNGNQLSVIFNNPENEKTFGMNEKYIEQKCEDYFGKRLRFRTIVEAKPGINPAGEESIEISKTDTHDPYEDIILNELGGKKLE